MIDASNPFEPPTPEEYMKMTDEELEADKIRAGLNVQRMIKEALNDS